MIHAFDTAQRLEEDVGLQGVVHTAGGLRGDLTAGVRDFKQFLLADRIRAFGGLTDGFVGESVGVRDGAVHGEDDGLPERDAFHSLGIARVDGGQFFLAFLLHAFSA